MPVESMESTLLTEFEELRQATRASAQSWWFPMIAFALVAFGGGWAALAPGAAELAWWVVASVAAMAAPASYYRRRSSTLGVVTKYRRLWVLWIPVSGAAFTAALVAPSTAKATAPWMVVAVGYLGLAAVGRSSRMAVVGALIGCVTIALLALSATDVTTEVTCGAVLFGCGLVTRSGERAR